MAQLDLPNGITVVGVGRVASRPDVCVIRIGAQAIDSTALVAMRQVNEAAAHLVAAANSAGVGDSDVQTAQLSVSPEYDYSGKRPKLIGHRASTSITLFVRDVDRAGSVVDVVIEAGGEFSVVDGVGFELEDTAAALVEARADAWSDALARASQLADLAGLTLGRAESISEGVDVDRPGGEAVYRLATDSSPSVVEPGQVVTTVRLIVRFAVNGSDQAPSWGFSAARGQ